MLFLLVRAHDYVAPYATISRMISKANADVVLVDPRGGLYLNDIVRGQQGHLGRPMVLSLDAVTRPLAERLCARGTVMIVDHAALRVVGLGSMPVLASPINGVEANLARRPCLRPWAP